MNDGETEDHSKNREIDVPNTAFFFDFDGTLADIVEDPEKVRISPAALDALDRLSRASGGAVAIVSGRPIDALDQFLSPLKLPLSGVHGLEWRDARGTVNRGGYDAGLLRQLGDAIEEFAANHTGLIVEHKPGSVALHYRQRPDLGSASLQLACKLAAKTPGANLMRGKMVVELRLGGRSKADAVADFMAVTPFRGRMPVFAGDDVTDENAFRLVEELGGLGIKVGDGETAASLRTPDRAAFERWLCDLSQDRGSASKQISGGQFRRGEPHAIAADHRGLAGTVAEANSGA